MSPPVISRGSSVSFNNVGSYRRAYIARSAGNVGIASSVPTSVRFNSTDSAYFSRTPSSSSNRKKWTWSGWVKRSSLSGYQPLFGAVSSTLDHSSIFFDNAYENNALCVWTAFGGGFSGGINVKTASIFRDVSSWYHIVVSVDTNQASLSNGVKVWVNGVAQTMSGTYTSGIDTYFNSILAHGVGYMTQGGIYSYLDGYLSNIHFIDGQALTADAFGFTDANNIWQPKAYSTATYGSYGTNGFYLSFSDTSAATATTLGKDGSGNGLNWTPNNISAIASSINYTSGTTFSGDAINTSSLFDGNDANGTNFGGLSGGSSPSGTTRTFSFTNLPSVTTSLRLKVYNGEGAGSNIRVNDGTPVTIPYNYPSGGYYTISGFTGTINSIKYTYGGGNLDQAALMGIEIDGVLIADQFGYNTDVFVDSPTSYGTDTGLGAQVRSNYCTFTTLGNGSSTPPSGGLSNGNLQVSGLISGGYSGSFAIPVGKWYWEVNVNSLGTPFVGVCNDSRSLTADPGVTLDNEYGFYINPTINYINGSGNPWGTGSIVAGDIIGVAVDATDYANIKIWLSKNNTWYSSGGGTSGNPAAGTNQIQTITGSATLYPFCAMRNAGTASTMHANFGQRAFSYTAPSGFKSLCTANLTSTTITTSGTFTGNANADGPAIYLNGVPTAMTINGNAVTFGTHADKLANGFKVRSSSSSYNTSGSNSYSVTSQGNAFKNARAQSNP